MSPEDQERVRRILEKKYSNIPERDTSNAKKHARIIREVEDFIQSIGLKQRDIILSCIIGQVYMDTTKDNDTAIAQLKAGKLIKETVDYIIDIDNILTKGE